MKFHHFFKSISTPVPKFTHPSIMQTIAAESLVVLTKQGQNVRAHGMKQNVQDAEIMLKTFCEVT